LALACGEQQEQLLAAGGATSSAFISESSIKVDVDICQTSTAYWSMSGATVNKDAPLMQAIAPSAIDRNSLKIDSMDASFNDTTWYAWHM
jgi:hypothetical protein